MEIKGRFPFRTGATSYVIPADMVTNVEMLAPLVDDVELLVFESDEMSELPDRETLARLRSIAEGERLTYTVHLPLDIWIGAPDETVRERSVQKCVRTIAAMRILDPFAWILHVNRGDRDGGRIHDDSAWAAAGRDSVAEILQTGIAPRSLCVEVLDGSFPPLWPMIESLDLSVCLDVGHMVVYRLPFEKYLKEFGGRSRVVHLHGVDGDKDHCSIVHLDREILGSLYADLLMDSRHERVVTLELFNERELMQSLAILEKFVE